MSAEAFARQLHLAEDRLRSLGLSGRAAYAALCRALADRLALPRHLWLDGPDAPPEAGLDQLPLTAELDLFGLAYERFFPEVFKAEHGQYFTPRPVVELMADLAGVGPRQRVLDPTCGAGSFLVIAHARGADVDGIEVDPELVALCRLNLKLHGADPRAVRRADLFRDPGLFDGGPRSGGDDGALFDRDERWDVVLANPPFSVEIRDAAALGRTSLAQGRAHVASDELFLEAAFRVLRPGGRLCALLPHSVVANARTARLRAWLDQRFVRLAVVALPEGVFRPFGGTGARACIVCLQKRPAPVVDWAAAVIESPGYDPARRTYHRQEPDELAALRLRWPDGLPRFPADEPSWDPAALLGTTGIAGGVPTTTLGRLAPYVPRQRKPGDDPDGAYVEIDLVDADKATGEVVTGRGRVGAEFRGTKATFDEGDLLFARIRPSLNSVAIARRPLADVDGELCGSAEWMRLVPPESPHFALVAARSPFVRAQLRGTGGRTRPRIRTRDLAPVVVPDPGADNRARIDALVRDAHDARARARRVLDQVDALYAAFGRGELDVDALAQSLDALRDRS
ncbi:MAG: N-6 DNA methylase [Alphaproteobacteria bacterium]|nr:N-6 DNA methylase [Alphaproteobacteria bacterium]